MSLCTTSLHKPGLTHTRLPKTGSCKRPHASRKPGFKKPAQQNSRAMPPPLTELTQNELSQLPQRMFVRHRPPQKSAEYKLGSPKFMPPQFKDEPPKRASAKQTSARQLMMGSRRTSLHTVCLRGSRLSNNEPAQALFHKTCLHRIYLHKHASAEYASTERTNCFNLEDELL
ncbi:hypothetical protein E2P81_ATG10377 [Venturia nashicola]|nr:hypothetical protein E2P81_ATG10377 [Venturia nashicola]